MEGNGWLRLHAIQRGYAVSQDSIRKYFVPEGAESQAHAASQRGSQRAVAHGFIG